MASKKEKAEWQKIVRNEYFRLKKDKEVEQADSVKSAWARNRERMEKTMMERERGRDREKHVWSVEENVKEPLITAKKAAVVDDKGN